MSEQDNVAVIDIGSNSIKILIVDKGIGNESLSVVFEKTIESRISEGINNNMPVINKEAMLAGLEAIKNLISETKKFDPREIRIVATSAVRDAANRDEFIYAVERDTGFRMQVLSGHEEAIYIAGGLTCDPILSDIDSFIQIDLGGGSLELIRFIDGTIDRVVSLQLGAFRLTEKFVSHVNRPLDSQTLSNISNYVVECISESKFSFLPIHIPLIATGGAFSVVRGMLAGSIVKNSLDISTSPVINHDAITVLKNDLASQTIEERIKHPYLPVSRADIMPCALVIIDCVLKIAQREKLTHSFCNLRYGVAAEMLATQGK